MKLYKIPDAEPGARWRSSKTGLTIPRGDYDPDQPHEVELPRDGRQGMADFLNANELEAFVKSGNKAPTDEPLDILEAAEARAVRASEAPPAFTRAPKVGDPATAWADWLYATADSGYIFEVFSALGSRFFNAAKKDANRLPSETT